LAAYLDTFRGVQVGKRVPFLRITCIRSICSTLALVWALLVLSSTHGKDGRMPDRAQHHVFTTTCGRRYDSVLAFFASPGLPAAPFLGGINQPCELLYKPHVSANLACQSTAMIFRGNLPPFFSPFLSLFTTPCADNAHVLVLRPPTCPYRPRKRRMSQERR
jgi:hypothetical protein